MTSATAARIASFVAGPVAPGRSFGASAPKTMCCRSRGIPAVRSNPSQILRTISAKDLACGASPGWPQIIRACRLGITSTVRGAGAVSTCRAAARPSANARIDMSLLSDRKDLAPPDLVGGLHLREHLAVRGDDLV